MSRKCRNASLRWGIFIFLSPLIIIGCDTIPKSDLGNGIDSSGNKLFLTSPDNRRNHLDSFLARHPEFSEEGKIQYLLESVESSKCQFLRNGVFVNGEAAMRWLRWKKNHPQYRRDPILTARDFIDRVADRSKTTGRLYEVVMPDGHREELRILLNNELSALESAFQAERLRQSLSENKPGGEKASSEISYAPVAIAPTSS